MIYTRASEDDWNRYASLTGDNGWKWSSILQYAKKVSHIASLRFVTYISECRSPAPYQLENFTNSQNVANASSKFVSAMHSTKGPVGVGLPQVSLPIDQIALNAQQELSDEFKYNQDVNSGDMIGMSACFTYLVRKHP